MLNKFRFNKFRFNKFRFNKFRFNEPGFNAFTGQDTSLRTSLFGFDRGFDATIASMILLLSIVGPVAVAGLIVGPDGAGFAARLPAPL